VLLTESGDRVVTKFLLSSFKVRNHVTLFVQIRPTFNVPLYLQPPPLHPHNDWRPPAPNRQGDRHNPRHNERLKQNKKRPKRRQRRLLGPLVCFFSQCFFLAITNNVFIFLLPSSSYDDDDDYHHSHPHHHPTLPRHHQ
jgi:hypothetical protein